MSSINAKPEEENEEDDIAPTTPSETEKRGRKMVRHSLTLFAQPHKGPAPRLKKSGAGEDDSN